MEISPNKGKLILPKGNFAKDHTAAKPGVALVPRPHRAFAALHSPSRLPQADRSAQEAAALQLATKQLEDQVAILSLTLQDREEQLRVSQQQVWTRLSSNLSPPWCW